MDLSRYTALFLADTREHLDRASRILLDWEREPGTLEPVAELFRAFHSVKGSAATMEYTALADLAHAAEHLLDAVRKGDLGPSRAVVSLLLRAVDVLERGAELVVAGEAVPDAPALVGVLERMVASGAPPAPAEPPLERRTPTRVPRPSARFTLSAVRVDRSRLDELLHRAAELVVARNRLDGLVARSSDPELEAVAGQVGTLARSMHAGVLRARLAPVAELFDRLPRVARDLGQSLDREVELKLRSDGIELDRGMLEELLDPLVHLVRNAVDHGIEPPAERLLAGKPPEGRLLLSASREREFVTVRLADDGRGIDRDAVARRAEEAGLRPAGRPPPDDHELLGLLARPGFTLRHEVTSISGRGVGMDVVLSTVRSLGGQVEVSSEPGQGTTFTLTLPLTTAIQRVLLVGAAGERYAIPFRIVAEAVRGPGPAATETTGGRFSFRDRSLPMVDLARATGLKGATAGRVRPMLVLEWGTRQGALAVDAVLGQLDVVIERVEAPVGLPAWVSGATILADGSPALVLDPTALFQAEASR